MGEHVVVVGLIGRRRVVLDEAGDEGGGESDALFALLGLRLLGLERPPDEVVVPSTVAERSWRRTPVSIRLGRRAAPGHP
jgi:hypothetical protein